MKAVDYEGKELLLSAIELVVQIVEAYTAGSGEREKEQGMGRIVDGKDDSIEEHDGNGCSVLIATQKRLSVKLEALENWVTRVVMND